jgi:hypothetical protein
MMYENPDPYEFTEPRGVVDTKQSVYEEIDDRTVEVTGTEFYPSDTYSIKLEGVREVGHRAITIFGIRDHELIEKHLDSFMTKSRELVAEKAERKGVDFQLHFNLYGKNGVMGDAEPETRTSHEVGVFVKLIAPTEEDAKALLHEVNSLFLHHGYPNRKSTAGNTAHPISPIDIAAGKAYEFNICHYTPVEDAMKFFDLDIEQVGA